METQMKIDGSLVRMLREEKSWSQEHLANAAGISARTIQRVEAEGLGSAETRLALAAALGVEASKLSSESSSSRKLLSAGFKRGRLWGWLGWSIGTTCALVAIVIGRSLGGASAGDIGFSVGVVCALSGVCAAMMGWLDMWARHRHSIDELRIAGR